MPSLFTRLRQRFVCWLLRDVKIPDMSFGTNSVRLMDWIRMTPVEPVQAGDIGMAESGRPLVYVGGEAKPLALLDETSGGGGGGGGGATYSAVWETKTLTGQLVGYNTLISSNLQNIVFDGNTFTAGSAGWIDLVAVFLTGNPGGTIQVAVASSPPSSVSGNNTDAIQTFSAPPGAWVTIHVRWHLETGDKLRLLYDGALGAGYPAERLRVLWTQ